MGYGMGFGIWDMGWDMGFGIWDGIWDLGYGMGFGIWDWDMGVWDWDMTPMGFGIFPNPTVWVASIGDTALFKGERTVKSRKESLWKLAEDLTIAFNLPNPITHKLFRNAKEMNR